MMKPNLSLWLSLPVGEGSLPSSSPFLGTIVLEEVTMLLVGLSCVTFIMLKCIPSVPNLLSFYHETMLNFIKFYFCIY